MAQVFHCREVYSGFSPDWQRGQEMEKLDDKNLQRESEPGKRAGDRES